jgi:hypothetical protein
MLEVFAHIQPLLIDLATIIIVAGVSYLFKELGSLVMRIAKKKDIEIKEADVKKITDDLSNIISKAIIATNQTFVNDLKSNGEFTKEKQEEAIRRAVDYCVNLMSMDLLEYLNDLYGDVEALLITEIEAAIGKSKKTSIDDITEEVVTEVIKNVVQSASKVTSV